MSPSEVKGCSPTSSSNSGVVSFFTYTCLWPSHPLFYLLTKDGLSGADVTAGYVWVHENLLKDTGFSERFAHNTILEISAFLSYMVIHTVHLRLEYGPEEQNALLSLELTMHSLFLWAPHFQEIQLHCLAVTFSREISKDGSTLNTAISTFGVQEFSGWNWTVACVPKGRLSISKPAGEASSLPTNSLRSLGEDAHTMRGCSRKPRAGCSVPVASTCCFVAVHCPPPPATFYHSIVVLRQDPASTGPKGETFSGRFLINRLGYPPPPFSLLKSSVQLLSFLLGHSK